MMNTENNQDKDSNPRRATKIVAGVAGLGIAVGSMLTPNDIQEADRNPQAVTITVQNDGLAEPQNPLERMNTEELARFERMVQRGEEIRSDLRAANPGLNEVVLSDRADEQLREEMAQVVAANPDGANTNPEIPDVIQGSGAGGVADPDNTPSNNEHPVIPEGIMGPGTKSAPDVDNNANNNVGTF